MNLFTSNNALAKYVIRVGDAISQFFNVFLFLGTNPNESISGRSYRLQNKSVFWMLMRRFVDFLFGLWEKDHCQKAYEADLKRAKDLLNLN